VLRYISLTFFVCISRSDPAAKAQAAAAPQIVSTPHLRTDQTSCHPFLDCERFSFKAEILKEKQKISHTSPKQGPGLLAAFLFSLKKIKSFELQSKENKSDL
jgi:hypothetical protein